jgi:phospholipid-translocating ATPase
MEGLEFARTYLDDLLCLSKGNFNEILRDVERVLIRLQKANLKVNASKSSFGKTEIDYLGYVVTRDGIKPQQKKIEAILKIARPSTVKEVRSFLGMVQYYRDIWQKRSHILAPLTELTGGENKKKFEWNESYWQKMSCSHTQTFQKNSFYIRMQVIYS